MRLIAIGDIHGDLAKLSELLDLTWEDDRVVVFLGDYIDRGPASRGVLELLCDLAESRSSDKFIFLRGHHEAVLLDWISGRASRDRFLQNGGLATVRSYVGEISLESLDRFPMIFPERHRDFIESTQLFYEDSSVFLSHAGFDPADPLSRSLDTLLYGNRTSPLTADAAASAMPGKKIVMGHYVQSSGQMLVDDPIYCIDTGCGTLRDGRLSALLIPEMRVMQI